jgi:hypothetical protein
MTDNHILIVAEMRAAELLGALSAAVAGDPHWRSQAQALLRSIANTELPERIAAQLEAVAARKHIAENHCG